ncbi:HupE/UreJ family protein [Algibacter agarivorans]|uniref:HupE/UreJ family protein n=2 Tax=Algibacter agarivorans TaxID=1109741 RepID=A0ABP9GGB6_9FLAO
MKFLLKFFSCIFGTQILIIMLQNFWFNVEYGINHVLDINAYDHVLFLIVLTVPYVFKNWKRVLLLVSMFTLGHTLSLVLAAYNVVTVNAAVVEFLIPITILIVALFNVFTSGKGAQREKVGVLFLSTLFFGLVHGLGFAREFKMLLGDTDNKLVLLLEFALGIELAQIIIVFIVLFLGYVVQTIFRFTKRDWIMVISAIVVGLVIPMILNSDFLS